MSIIGLDKRRVGQLGSDTLAARFYDPATPPSGKDIKKPTTNAGPNRGDVNTPNDIAGAQSATAADRMRSAAKRKPNVR